MAIRVYLVKDAKNGYSLPPLAAALADFDDVAIEIIKKKTLDEGKLLGDSGDVTVIACSFNSIEFRRERDRIGAFVRRLKGGGALCIAGGSHPSAAPDELLSLGFDTVVVGSGEEAIRHFIRTVKDGCPARGILKKAVRDLDCYPPFPEKRRFYKPIEITRGCPHRCYFCQTNRLFPGKPIHRSPENVIRYVKGAFDRGIRDFRFITPDALGYCADENGKPSFDRIRKLVCGIRDVIGAGGRLFFGTFPSEMRPEFVRHDIMAFLRATTDNKSVLIGAQSGSERMLKACNRGHSLEAVHTAVGHALDAGFTVDLDIILGMPEERPHDVEQTLAFIDGYAGKPVSFHLHYFLPLPGTAWAKRAPVPLADNFRKEFEKLVGQGRAWGGWLAQKAYTKF